MRALSRISAALAFRLASGLKKTRLTINGDWGRFRGRTDDRVMLAHYARHGSWSAGTVAVLAQAARDLVARGLPEPLVVDVGAAIGLVSIGVLRQAPGRALAIEPSPEAFTDLQYNIRLHGLDRRLAAKNLAVGAPGPAARHVEMAQTPGNGGDSWVTTEHEGAGGAAVLSLDELIAGQVDSPLLLKIDVQGYEPQVLAGGKETIARAKMSIIEFWPFGLRRLGNDPVRFIDELLEDRERIALMRDEHMIQDLRWVAVADARVELNRLAANTAPERQVEIILGEPGS